MSRHTPWIAGFTVTALGFLALFSGRARAQCAQWNGSFELAGFDGDVRATLVFDDGSGPKLYAGGDFTHVGTTAVAHLARWNGSGWEGVAGGLDGPVYALAAWNYGSGQALYVGGSFQHAGVFAANSIARWDGRAWYALGAGVQGTVRSVASYDDGNGDALFVGGSFTIPGLNQASCFARWTPAGWSGASLGISSAVHALCVYDDGGGPALFLGGDFEMAQGVNIYGHLARWNGAHLAGVTPWLGLSSSVRAIVVHDDGSGPKLFVGGQLISGAPFQPRFEVGTWDGTSWNLISGSNFGDPILAAHSFLVHDDGSGAKLYAGGTFTSLHGTPASRIARWDGSSWSQVGAGFEGDVLALSAYDEGSGAHLFAAGSFKTSGAASTVRFARFDGTSWNAILPGKGIDGSVVSLVAFDDGSGLALYAAGSFHAAGGAHAENVARWDGTTWSPVGAGLLGNGVIAAHVNSLVVYDDGSGPALYAAGSFANPVGNVARWDGTGWQPAGSGTNGYVSALAVYDNGSGSALYALGGFTSPGLFFARWNGSTWTGISGVFFDDHVGDGDSLAVYNDGTGAKLYVGGVYNIFVYGPGGVTAHHDIDGSAYTMVTFNDGSGNALYVGGNFLSVGNPSVPANSLARLKGTQWSSVGSGVNGAVGALARFDVGLGYGTALYVGGGFTTAGGVACNNVARWDGAQFTALASGVSGGVSAFCAVPSADMHGPDLYIGGSFGTAGDSIAASIARWRGCDGPGDSFCAADMLATPCPCAQSSAQGHGCANSQNAAGALLTSSGTVHPDALVLTSSGELANALSIFLQGNALQNPAVTFGDGLRCTGGSLKRLYAKNASSGTAIAPAAGDPSITARSAALGDPIPAGATRYYQTYYRDPNLAFCPAPQGDSWNVTNGVKVVW